MNIFESPKGEEKLGVKVLHKTYAFNFVTVKMQQKKKKLKNLI